eukprot:scaffold33617_cov96-Isochrysis_galbana.AAC.2
MAIGPADGHGVVPHGHKVERLQIGREIVGPIGGRTAQLAELVGGDGLVRPVGQRDEDQVAVGGVQERGTRRGGQAVYFGDEVGGEGAVGGGSHAGGVGDESWSAGVCGSGKLRQQGQGVGGANPPHGLQALDVGGAKDRVWAGEQGAEVGHGGGGEG